MIGIESAMPTGTSVMSTAQVETPAATESTATEPAEGGTPAPLTAATAAKAGLKTVVPGATVQPPAYSPNHKFKVMDKEHEFDEWAKGAAKDPDTEKKVRELYEKAYGLDSVKQDRQSIRTELAKTKEKMASTDRAIEQIAEYAKVKDWDSFFETLNIPKNDVLRYALDLVQREQMPPDQKAQWESSRQAQQQAKYYQEQNQQLQQSQQQFQVQQREFQLDTEISKPEYSAISEAYNAGMQKQGAFREYVIRIGQAHAAQGTDVSPQQAAQEAMRHLRAVNPTLGVQSAQTQAASNVVAASNKPVLPNIQGRGTSAVKSTIRSLDDLRAKAREMDSRS
jgi:hypothetical protein